MGPRSADRGNSGKLFHQAGLPRSVTTASMGPRSADQRKLPRPPCLSASNANGLVNGAAISLIGAGNECSKVHLESFDCPNAVVLASMGPRSADRGIIHRACRRARGPVQATASMGPRSADRGNGPGQRSEILDLRQCFNGAAIIRSRKMPVPTPSQKTRTLIGFNGAAIS